MSFRYGSAAIAAGGMTAAALLVMTLLLEQRVVIAATVRDNFGLSSVRVEEPTPVEKEFHLPPPPDSPVRPPSGNTIGLTFKPASLVTLPPGRGLVGLPTGTTPGQVVLESPDDGPAVALVAVQPLYPQRLAAKGIEGHVIVAFDVSAAGTTENARVVESSHAGFERAALQAIDRFRYQPRVVDGVALRTTGLQRLFTFQMERD